MVGWHHVVAAAAATVVLVLLLAAFLWRCCCHNYKLGRATHSLQLQPGVNHASPHRKIDSDHGYNNHYKVGTYSVSRRGPSPTKLLFSWADQPSLVTDAVENGWSGFGFTSHVASSPPARSALLGLCAAGDSVSQGSEVQIGWEITHGSADFIQKIRLNSGFKKPAMVIGANSGSAASSVVRAALPLPGPPLGNHSFPQEAYFEITVLYSGEGDEADGSDGKIREGERAKLIHQQSSESMVHISRNQDLSSKDRRFEDVVSSIGLTGGGALPLRHPGSYPASIGFNSDGSVYLDGIKLVYESEKAEWGRKEQVIGCGFDPRNKKVFFTVDSELVHVFHCQSNEFGTPLYPTLAANSDIMVLVNFGQCAFAYAPANSQRTPNPCFNAPIGSSPAAALGYDDSKELFSMGRIDAQWLNRSTTKGSHNNGNNTGLTEDVDAESEADLFEIVLDRTGRSPNTNFVTQ